MRNAALPVENLPPAEPEFAPFARRAAGTRGAGDTRNAGKPRKIPGRVMRAEDDCWLVRMLVKPDQIVKKGDELYEIQRIDDGGTILTIKSTDCGVVRPIEGWLQMWDADRELSGVHIRRGAALFRIAPVIDGWNAGTIRGLTPRPTRVMYLRRMRMLELKA